MQQIPKPGEFYRHFKDKLYQVITVAIHSETGEALVIYQALYGDFKVYARPLEMFLSEVDHEKYPEAEQNYRFQKVEFSVSAGVTGPESDTERAAVPAKELNPLVLPFVESETYEQQMEILAAMRGKIGQEELDILYVALDLPQRSGDPDQQLDAIEKYLTMQKRFDGNRLR